MNLDEYQSAARATAIYPNLGANLTYPALGLAGEAAEVLEKVERTAPAAQVAPELGDVLWYVASLAAEADLSLSAVVGDPEFPVQLSLSPISRSTATAGMLIAVGRVLELVKKVHRDSGGVLTPARRLALSEGLLAVLNSAALVAFTFELDLADVAAANVAKLRSRMDRGVLHGSGDAR